MLDATASIRKFLFSSFRRHTTRPDQISVLVVNHISKFFVLFFLFGSCAHCGQNRRHALKPPPPPNRIFISHHNTIQTRSDALIRLHVVIIHINEAKNCSIFFACIDVAHSQSTWNSASNANVCVYESLVCCRRSTLFFSTDQQVSSWTFSSFEQVLVLECIHSIAIGHRIFLWSNRSSPMYELRRNRACNKCLASPTLRAFEAVAMQSHIPFEFIVYIRYTRIFE